MWGKIPGRRSSKYKAADADMLLVCWRKECQSVKRERKSSEYFPTEMMLAVGFSYTAFIMLKYVPSTPTLLRVFIRNGFWIQSKAVSVSNKMII